MRAQEKQHAEKAPKTLAPSLRRISACLDKEIRRLEQKIDALKAADDTLRRNDALLQSMPGIGSVTSHSLLALLPELGTVSKKEIAALAGVAPFACESGQWKGQRHIYGGRAAVREKLYMAALVARVYNPVIRSFYERLSDEGKGGKVALVACMHKILTILNAMMRDKTPWSPSLKWTA